MVLSSTWWRRKETDPEIAGKKDEMGGGPQTPALFLRPTTIVLHSVEDETQTLLTRKTVIHSPCAYVYSIGTRRPAHYGPWNIFVRSSCVGDVSSLRALYFSDV